MAKATAGEEELSRVAAVRRFEDKPSEACASLVEKTELSRGEL